MTERRYRRTFFVARGRLESFRPRYTFARVSVPINENEPPYEDHRLDFYNIVAQRITAYRSRTITVAP